MGEMEVKPSTLKGIPWDLLRFNGDSIGISWVLLRFTGICWDFMCFFK
jgi:hypothetical protein